MIKIICIGKIKEPYIQDAILNYQRRIMKYIKIQIIELPNQTNHILLKEKNDILKYINAKDYVISLDIQGKEMTSIEFAKKLETTFIQYSNITFIIGGSYGLHEEIKKRSHFLLSFSKMTFPHQLFRVILLEQLYRCFKINHHECYHK